MNAAIVRGKSGPARHGLTHIPGVCRRHTAGRPRTHREVRRAQLGAPRGRALHGHMEGLRGPMTASAGSPATDAAHRWRSSLLGEPKRLDLAQGAIEYFERGRGPTVVLAHGWV